MDDPKRAPFIGGKLLHLNPAAAKMTGVYAAQDLKRKPIRDSIHPDFHQVVLARVNGQSDGGTATSVVEEEWRRLDAATNGVEVHAVSSVYDEEAAVQSAMHDVTERKRVWNWLRSAGEPPAVW